MLSKFQLLCRAFKSDLAHSCMRRHNIQFLLFHTRLSFPFRHPAASSTKPCMSIMYGSRVPTSEFDF